MNLDNYKTTDYCTKCGESPDSATHWFMSKGHVYSPPRDAALRVVLEMEQRELEKKLRQAGYSGD